MTHQQLVEALRQSDVAANEIVAARLAQDSKQTAVEEALAHLQEIEAHAPQDEIFVARSSYQQALEELDVAQTHCLTLQSEFEGAGHFLLQFRIFNNLLPLRLIEFARSVAHAVSKLRFSSDEERDDFVVAVFGWEQFKDARRLGHLPAFFRKLPPGQSERVEKLFFDTNRVDQLWNSPSLKHRFAVYQVPGFPILLEIISINEEHRNRPSLRSVYERDMAAEIAS